jgi:hypothetical protein
MLICAIAWLALASCSGGNDDTSDAAEDFAARINGGTPAAEATPAQAPTPVAAPTVVPPREAGTQAPLTINPATGKIVQACNADAMGPFLGRLADDATRLDVMATAQGASDVRFIAPGTDFIASDPANPRLNLMLDAEGIIRDARCG